MTLLFSMGLVFLVMLVIFQCVTISVYGFPIDQSVWYTKLANARKVELNSFNYSILRVDEYPFISSHMFPIYSKYYIYGVGVVPRWSKTHRLISTLYKMAEFELNNKRG